MRWTICLHESLHNWIVKFVMIMRILLKSCLRNQALKLNSVTVEIGFKKIRNVSKVRLEIAKYLKKKQIELKELSNFWRPWKEQDYSLLCLQWYFCSICSICKRDCPNTNVDRYFDYLKNHAKFWNWFNSRQVQVIQLNSHMNYDLFAIFLISWK